MSNRFTLTFTARPEHIDENGHVNNAVWVQWMERLATAHWEAVALAEHQRAFAWVVTRHEIDYRGNIAEGDTVEGLTEIREAPRGARFDRYFIFTDGEGRQVVKAKTTWAMIDRESSRIMRVPAEVAAPFLPEDPYS
ncbi:acyl-CoA thioester hydrolase [Altererythrobacter atlanticus]|uniref:Acyl-ACP thioesterase n=1 Tax=Croceibacterium atlanticum TaxID=1267766 RepID=A0A0F7KVA1_9SPHN|nr:acyl-CoA thioesterase [Croceibacterium atlanticum]AKH43106.1 Acyl-ACP thioesterase [Croceibacterium atlanticum]MBB5732190.1 acyl-CoA thioester hydrolase [Croceibacterium atlanticum]